MRIIAITTLAFSLGMLFSVTLREIRKHINVNKHDYVIECIAGKEFYKSTLGLGYIGGNLDGYGRPVMCGSKVVNDLTI